MLRALCFRLKRCFRLRPYRSYWIIWRKFTYHGAHTHAFTCRSICVHLTVWCSLDVKVIRIAKLRKKYQAKRNAAKASGDTVEAAKPPPTFSQLLSFVLLTEDRSEPFEELLSYSVNSVVFILNFTVSFFYPQCSAVTLFYFFVKFYLDKSVSGCSILAPALFVS